MTKLHDDTTYWFFIDCFRPDSQSIVQEFIREVLRYDLTLLDREVFIVCTCVNWRPFVYMSLLQWQYRWYPK